MMEQNISVSIRPLLAHLNYHLWYDMADKNGI